MPVVRPLVPRERMEAAGGTALGVVCDVADADYNMAKEATRALTRTAAREWGADGITVNNVQPVAQTWGDIDVPPPSNALGRFHHPCGKAADRRCAVAAPMYDPAMTPTDLLVPTYQHMLQTLSGLLDKVQQQMPDQAEAALEARLAADMFPLATQVRFAAFQAQEAVFRLRGEPIPDWLDAIAAEARNAGDAPGTIADAKARLNDALSFLEDVSSSDLDAGAGLSIAIELPGGMTFDMTGEEYARDWALPQFYFHVITAYAILRNQGVAIGKADYVPHMFAYLRPTTMPSGS